MPAYPCRLEPAPRELPAGPAPGPSHPPHTNSRRSSAPRPLLLWLRTSSSRPVTPFPVETNPNSRVCLHLCQRAIMRPPGSRRQKRSPDLGETNTPCQFQRISSQSQDFRLLSACYLFFLAPPSGLITSPASGRAITVSPRFMATPSSLRQKATFGR